MFPDVSSTIKAPDVPSEPPLYLRTAPWMLHHRHHRRRVQLKGKGGLQGGVVGARQGRWGSILQVLVV